MEESSLSTTSALNASGGVKTLTFYGWKYNHYFVVVEEGEKNLRVRCTLCAPSQKTLSSARNTTSNFKKHLDTVHKATNLVGRNQRKKSDQEIVLKFTSMNFNCCETSRKRAIF